MLLPHRRQSAISLVRFAIFSEFFASSTKRYQARTCVSSSVSIRTAKVSTLFYSAGRESVISSSSASLSSALNVNGLTLFPSIYAGMLLFVDDLRRVSHYERLTPHYETYTCTRIIGPRYKEHLSFSLLLSARCDITFYIPPRPLAALFAVFFVLFFSVFPSSRFFIRNPMILCGLIYLSTPLHTRLERQKI